MLSFFLPQHSILQDLFTIGFHGKTHKCPNIIGATASTVNYYIYTILQFFSVVKSILYMEIKSPCLIPH